MSSHHAVTAAIQPPDRLIPVAQYVRMSTEHQRYSTENQAAATTEYAKAHGAEIVQAYEDSRKSELNLKGRSALQADHGEFDWVDPLGKRGNCAVAGQEQARPSSTASAHCGHQASQGRVAC